MDKKIKFLIICIVFSLFTIAAVSASDNSTEISDENSLMATEVDNDIPIISINTTKVYTNKSIGITLKDSNNTSISNQKLTANIDNETYSLVTNNKGVASLNLKLKPNSYVLNVLFEGNDRFSNVSNSFNIDVLKLDSKITPISTSVFYNKYFEVNLKDKYGKLITGEIVTFKVNKTTFSEITDNNGKAKFKITLTPNAKYNVEIGFAGNDYYNAVSKIVTLTVPATTSVVIGNDKLLTDGYLRVYLKSTTSSAISKKTIKITIGKKKFSRKTNSEGMLVFKPNLEAKNYVVSVTFEGSDTIIGCSATKNVTGVKGSTKNPLNTKIPLYKGRPDIDVMPGNYVMADVDAKYCLLKDQYLAVINRDSYTLFLYNKLSKYVFFKTESEPKLNHIIVREKWNVIERAVNTKVVKANKNNYWPSKITVSLKGKSYTYSQVRDIQNTGYTCGPTSCSMCSQFLKSYISEKQFAVLAKSTPQAGSNVKNLKKALEKCNFKCEFFYKSSFQKGINALKKGGCALVFHTWDHYVTILDISKDGKKVLIGNPSGSYNEGSHGIPTKWVSLNFIYNKFNNYNTASLIVKLKYSVSNSKKTQIKNLYSSFGTGWTAQNTNERIPDIGL